MRSLAGYIMRSRWHAVAGVAALGVLTWALPPVTSPLSYLSGAAIGLTVLRHGGAEGLKILVGALALAGLVAWLAAGSPLPAILLLAVWVPAVGGALVLRVSMSQGWMAVTAGLLAVAVVVGMHVAVGDVTQWWLGWLERLEQALPSGTGMRLDDDARVRLASVMTGVVGAATAVNVIVTVLLARWWQGLLYNPGGFRDEFQALRLPRVLLPATGLMALLALVQGHSGGDGAKLGAELLLLATVLYLFQGLAVVHYRLRARTYAKGWLVLLYVSLALLPQYTVFMLGLLGAADVVMDFRRLAGKRPGNGPESAP